MPTLPTLSAVGAGLGSALFVTQRPCGAFSYLILLGAGNCPHPAAPSGRGVGGRVRRSGVSDPVEVGGEGVDAAAHLHEVFAIDLPVAVEFATPRPVGSLDASVEFGRFRRQNPEVNAPGFALGFEFSLELASAVDLDRADRRRRDRPHPRTRIEKRSSRRFQTPRDIRILAFWVLPAVESRLEAA